MSTWRERTILPYNRHSEHSADGLRLLDYLLTFPQNTPDNGWPSTAELQEMKIFGLRPVNRLVDARAGKYRSHRYDIERINCGGGIFRWRLYWPNRAGFPKTKNQSVLPLSESEREPSHYGSMAKARRSRGSWKSQSIFTTKSWQQISAERERKLSAPEPDFVLTP